MAAAVDLSLADSVPVTRYFKPARIADSFAVFENRAGGIYVGYDKLTLSLTRPSGPKMPGQNRNVKVKVKVELPLLKEESTGSTVSGFTSAPEVDYRMVFDGTFTMPEQCAYLDRQNLRALVLEALAETPIVAAIETYEAVY